MNKFTVKSKVTSLPMRSNKELRKGYLWNNPLEIFRESYKKSRNIEEVGIA